MKLYQTDHSATWWTWLANFLLKAVQLAVSRLTAIRSVRFSLSMYDVPTSHAGRRRRTSSFFLERVYSLRESNCLISCA